MGERKYCSNCGKATHNFAGKDMQQSFFLEESNYWQYSDGKIVPTVNHHYFCSKKCLAEWALNQDPLTPPVDLNQWENGRKMEVPQ